MKMQTPPQDANHARVPKHSNRQTWESSREAANTMNGTPNWEDFIVGGIEQIGFIIGQGWELVFIAIAIIEILRLQQWKDFIVGGIKQISFIIGQGWEQIFVVINHQPNTTIFKSATVIKNTIKSGSTSAQEIMAHDPW